MKYCSQCHQPKPRTEYYRRTRSWDGYTAACKQCSGESDRIRRIERKNNVILRRGPG